MTTLEPPNPMLLLACRTCILTAPMSIMFYTFFMKMYQYDLCKITVGENNDFGVWFTSIVLAIVCVFCYDSLHREEVIYLEKMKNAR